MINGMKDQRKRWIDICKCVGIITVMLGHLSFSIPGGHMRIFYCFYMPMFFVLSGYFIKQEKLSVTLAGKSKRLLIPYVIYSCILIMVACIPYTKETSHEIVNWIIGIFYSRKCLYTYESENNIVFMGKEQGVLWFLTCMFIAYLLSQFCLKFRERYRWIILAVYLAAGMALSLLPILLPWSLDMAFVASILMIFGFYINKLNFEELSPVKLLVVILASCLVYIPLKRIDGENNMSVRIFGQYGIISVINFCLLGFSGSLICMSVAKLIERFKFTEIFAAVGRISLILFCTHRIIFKAAEYLIADYVHNKYVYTLINITAAIAFGFLLTYIFNKASRKVRLFSYLK